MYFLTEYPMAELLEALDDERNGSGVGPFLQRFLPFFFVVGGIGAVEGSGIDTDGVVKVSVENAIGRLRVPFRVDQFDLICHGLLTCRILLADEPSIQSKGVEYEESCLVQSIFYFGTARTDCLVGDPAAAVVAVYSVRHYRTGRPRNQSPVVADFAGLN